MPDLIFDRSNVGTYLVWLQLPVQWGRGRRDVLHEDALPWLVRPRLRLSQRPWHHCTGATRGRGWLDFNWRWKQSLCFPLHCSLIYSGDWTRSRTRWSPPLSELWCGTCSFAGYPLTFSRNMESQTFLDGFFPDENVAWLGGGEKSDSNGEIFPKEPICTPSCFLGLDFDPSWAKSGLIKQHGWHLMRQGWSKIVRMKWWIKTKRDRIKRDRVYLVWFTRTTPHGKGKLTVRPENTFRSGTEVNGSPEYCLWWWCFSSPRTKHLICSPPPSPRLFQQQRTIVWIHSLINIWVFIAFLSHQSLTVCRICCFTGRRGQTRLQHDGNQHLYGGSQGKAWTNESTCAMHCNFRRKEIKISVSL